ncbi:huntington disease protein [Anaeramoeba flamelloides]|uniref:Huntington disease protein n=1 Tax=Anaeramoeba flamelloides TaxID=1746091 RepID=A0ABQ8XDR0_9EUKA|nr:huntington disease protein [Anaeramoeba flamelloides]
MRKIIFKNFELILENISNQSSILIKEYLHSLLQLIDLLSKGEFEMLLVLFKKTLTFGNKVNDPIIKQYSILGICFSIAILGKTEEINAIIKVLKSELNCKELSLVITCLNGLLLLLNGPIALPIQPILTFLYDFLIKKLCSGYFMNKHLNQILHLAFILIIKFPNENSTNEFIDKLIDIVFEITEDLDIDLLSMICNGFEKLILLQILNTNQRKKILDLIHSKHDNINPNFFLRLFSFITTLIYLETRICGKILNPIKQNSISLLFLQYKTNPFFYTKLFNKIFPKILFDNLNPKISLKLLINEIYSIKCFNPILLSQSLFKLTLLINDYDTLFNKKLLIYKEFLLCINSNKNNLNYYTSNEKAIYLWKFSLIFFCLFINNNGKMQFNKLLFKEICLKFHKLIEITDIFPIFKKIILEFLSLNFLNNQRKLKLLLKVQDKFKSYESQNRGIDNGNNVNKHEDGGDRDGNDTLNNDVDQEIILLNKKIDLQINDFTLQNEQIQQIKKEYRLNKKENNLKFSLNEKKTLILQIENKIRKLENEIKLKNNNLKKLLNKNQNNLNTNISNNKKKSNLLKIEQDGITNKKTVIRNLKERRRFLLNQIQGKK